MGYGNIGRYTLQALEAAPDFEVAGIVRRQGAANRPAELEKYTVTSDIRELGQVDVAILATPTRSVEAYAKEMLALGIHTVDSFDIHTQIVDLRRSLDAVAKEHGAVSIISVYDKSMSSRSGDEPNWYVAEVSNVDAMFDTRVVPAVYVLDKARKIVTKFPTDEQLLTIMARLANAMDV